MKTILVLVVFAAVLFFVVFRSAPGCKAGRLKKVANNRPAPADSQRGDVAAQAVTPPAPVQVSAPVKVSGAPQGNGVSYEDAAYWATVKDLTVVGDMPAGLLEDVRPVVLRAMSLGNEQAARVVCEALRRVEWNWSAWPAYAEQAGYSTLDGIAGEVAALGIEDRLGLLARQELVDLCKRAGVKAKARDSRAVMIATLIAGIDESELTRLTDRAVVEHIGELRDSCLQEMASQLVFRVSRLAHCLERYEQLSDPGLLSLLPNWKFVCEDGALPRCRNFDGMVLPAGEAEKRFPRLPCDNLGCRCRITAVG